MFISGTELSVAFMRVFLSNCIILVIVAASIARALLAGARAVLAKPIFSDARYLSANYLLWLYMPCCTCLGRVMRKHFY